MATDIKVGEVYFLPVRVTSLNDNMDRVFYAVEPVGMEVAELTLSPDGKRCRILKILLHACFSGKSFILMYLLWYFWININQTSKRLLPVINVNLTALIIMSKLSIFQLFRSKYLF